MARSSGSVTGRHAGILTLPRILRRISAICALMCTAGVVAQADPKTVRPVALVLEARDGRNSEGSPQTNQITRRNDQSSLDLRSGEILLAGDSIQVAAHGDVWIAFCPSATAFHVRDSGTLTFTDRAYSIAKGAAADVQRLAVCSLPDVFPGNHSGDDYGPSLVRTLSAGTGPVGTFASRLAALDPAARTQVEAGRGPLDAAISANAQDVLALLARGSLYQRQGMHFDAARDFNQAAPLLGNPAWLAPVLNTAGARATHALNTNLPLKGTTYAVVVGVSEFPNLAEKDQLQYAHLDAGEFVKFLAMPRGGGLQPDLQLRQFINAKATKRDVENALSSFLIANAGPDDTVILFIASHGVVEDKTNRSYILTSESDLQKLDTTAIPMERLLEVLDSKRCQAGRVLIFVDVCHAAHVGDFRSRTDDVMPPEISKMNITKIFAASRGSEKSFEDTVYGGGHGAFSYFLLRGLNTDEAKGDPKSSVVLLRDLIPYVQGKVFAATDRRQYPQEMGHLDPMMPIVRNTEMSALKLLDYPTHPAPSVTTVASAGERGVDLTPQPAPVQQFRDAIAAGRVLQGETGSAFEQLTGLRQFFGDDRRAYLAEENRLRSALESSGEQVLLQYLKGDEVPQSQVDFERASRLYASAAALTPEAHEFHANELFCRGRALISAHRYADAMPLLEEAARITPDQAYVWNGLGIGYLQIPDYDRAEKAFQDAIRRAPFWAYPRHNLALALRERGNLAGAIQQYLAAIPLAPHYSYLHYNLGLLYQQINDSAKAAQAYADAAKLAMAAAANAARKPAVARIEIAQAMLDARKNSTAALDKLKDAEALHPDPEDLLALRYDRGLILASDSNRHDEAVQQWLDNLNASPGHMPSMVALAESYERWNQPAKAIEWYGKLLAVQPDYLAARLHLAELQAGANPAQALQTLRAGLPASQSLKAPPPPKLQLAIGDVSRRIGNRDDATAAYCSVFAAKDAAPDMRAQARAKLKQMQLRAETVCAARR